MKETSPAPLGPNSFRLHYLPPFRPDEAFASILFRGCDHSGLRLRGSRSCLRVRQSTPFRRGGTLRFAGFLKALHQRFTSDETLPRKMIRGHCLYPFLAPFASPKQRRIHLRWAISGGQNTAKFGSTRSIGAPGSFRLCPACVEEDLATFDEPYFHRFHQIPGVQLCVVHRLRLQETDSDIRGFGARTAREIVENPSFSKTPRPAFISASLANHFSEGLKYLGESDPNPFASRTNNFWRVYQRIFLFRLPTKRMVEKLLCGIEAEHGDSLDQNFQWNSWSRPGIFNFLRHATASETLPLAGHFILLQHMGLSVEQGLHLANLPSLWCCPNGHCESYGKFKLRNQLRINHALQIECPDCRIRFKFAIRTPLGSKPTMLRLISPGPRLIEGVSGDLRAGLSMQKVAANAKISVPIIRSLAVEEGLIEHKTKKAHRHYPTTYSKLMEGYKQTVLSWLSLHPGATRVQLLRAHTHIYRRLRSEEPEWFESNLPKSRKKRRRSSR